MAFKDYFSKQSTNYLQFRPTYPHELFEYVARLPKEHHCVWDCATGNGQAAIKLADYFDKVIATDSSAEQIKQAIAHPKVYYSVQPAEKISVPDHSLDLITVAQALHWFDFPKFYAEVRRVLKPGGFLAAWCYPFVTFNDPKIQVVFIDFALNFLKDYWPIERAYCDSRYKDIPFELNEIAAPEYSVPLEYTLDQFVGYLGSWSAVQLFKNKHQIDPIETIILPKLQSVWGHPAISQTMQLDIILKVGKV